jgi:hypothetical protein
MDNQFLNVFTPHGHGNTTNIWYLGRSTIVLHFTYVSMTLPKSHVLVCHKHAKWPIPLTVGVDLTNDSRKSHPQHLRRQDMRITRAYQIPDLQESDFLKLFRSQCRDRNGQPYLNVLTPHGHGNTTNIWDLGRFTIVLHFT